MERAGPLLGKLRLKVMDVAGIKVYHLTPRAWSAAVGKTIAAHSRPVFLDGTRLVVEVEDDTWKSQLSQFAGQILGQLDKILGAGCVTRLEFRVAPPRRRPGLAGAAKAEPIVDEAEAIGDPVFRQLYKSARRKAGA